MSPDLRFVHLPRQQPTGFSDHQQKSRTDHTLPGVVATRTVTSPDRTRTAPRSAVTSAAIGRTVGVFPLSRSHRRRSGEVPVRFQIAYQAM